MAKRPDDWAIRALTDREIVALIDVLSKQLRDYVNEWQRRCDSALVAVMSSSPTHPEEH